MDWLKGLGISVKVAVLAFLAALAVAAAKRHKDSALKWQDKAVSIDQGNVVKGIETAKAAATQAKLHEEKAEEIKKKGEARINEIGRKDESLADILDQFRKSK